MAEVEQRPTPFGALRSWWEQESRRPTGGSAAARIAQLSRRRNVLRMLVVRDFKKRYENSYLGYAWAVIEPALLISIYWLVFHKIARLGIDHYVLFIATAIMPWLWFRNVVQGSSASIASNAKLVSSINLPREIYPAALVLTEGLEFLMTLPVVWVVALFYGTPPTHYLVFYPLVILLELVLVTGAALLMSALTTMFRDVDRVLSPLLRIFFYLTPVIYPTGRIHGAPHFVYTLDPLVGIFELHRKVFFPDTHITAQMIATSIVGAFVIFAIGWWVFIRFERSMLKEL